MENNYNLEEGTLNRIPPSFIFVLILLLGFPIVSLNFFGFDFSAITHGVGIYDTYASKLIENEIRGYFRQALLQWSAFSLSAITVLLAFTQYQLTRDKVAMIIGLSILFSGSVEALYTIIIDGITPDFIDKSNLDAVIWTFSNTISGLILIIGLSLLIKYDSDKKFSLSIFILISILTITIAFTLIYYAAIIVKLPTMWFPDTALSRPYELIYLSVYLIIALVIYPKIYKLRPTILSNCIFYMAITEVVIAVYMMLLSNSPYDSGYNVAYFLKIIVYLIPFSCLILNYIFSYNAVIRAQNILRISREKLRYIAAHDSLTDLYNRREFKELLDSKIANSAREDESFAVFLIDIDNFKTINDTLGHMCGDEYIKKFSERMRKLTRKGDIISRIGGDEFTLITNKLKSHSDAVQLADRLVEGLGEPTAIGCEVVTNTVSIGIAIFPDDGTNNEELLKYADIAMYSSKYSGKNAYTFYRPDLSLESVMQSKFDSDSK